MANFFGAWRRQKEFNLSPYRLPWTFLSVELQAYAHALHLRHGYSTIGEKAALRDSILPLEEKVKVRAPSVARVFELTQRLRKAEEDLLSLGCSRQKVRRLVETRKELLLREAKHILPKAALFKRYGINSSHFCEGLERTSPKGQFLLASDEKHERMFKFLQNSFQLHDLGKLVSKLPSILGYRVQSLEAKKQLWEELGVLVSGSMLERFPVMFTLGSERIRDGVNAVRSTFSTSVSEKLLLNFPTIVLRDRHHFEESILWLEEVLGKDITEKLLISHPQNVLVSCETMQHTYGQLNQQFGKEATLKLLQAFPLLLGSSWGTMKPKIEFILSEMGYSEEEIVKYPMALLFSLDKRLKPRYRSLMKAGKKRLSLRTIFAPSDTLFMKKFGVELQIAECKFKHTSKLNITFLLPSFFSCM